MGVPLKDKRAFLAERMTVGLSQWASEVDTLYGSVDAAPNIETQYGAWRFTWFRTRKERVSVMGNPLWYVEILHVGPTDTAWSEVDGTWVGGVHQFGVVVMLEYKEDGSTALFDDMIDGEGSKLGLMPYLRATGLSKRTYACPAPDDPTRMARATLTLMIRETGDEAKYRDIRSMASFDLGTTAGKDRAHMLSFRVGIGDMI